MIALIAASLLTLGHSATIQDPQTATIQLPDSQRVTGALLADINGDQLPDLILACRHTGTGKRILRMYERNKKSPAFSSTPSRPPYEVDSDVIAFTFCDYKKTPGCELILLTAEQVVAVVAGKDGAPIYTRLANHQLIWPAADASLVVPLPNAAVDIDGDNHTDLMLPSPDGWSVWFQDVEGDDSSFTQQSQIKLPQRQNSIGNSAGGRGRSSGSITFGMRMRGSRPGGMGGRLVSTSTRSPQCQAIDLDGDGNLDLVTYRNGSMHAGMQLDPRSFTQREQSLPLPENRLKAIDPAFNVQWSDINGDSKSDLLLTTSAQRDGDVEARVDLFLADGNGGWADKPTARLRMQTLARKPQLVDADGDGKDDLVCITLRTSAMANITSLKSSSFDAQLNIYRNSGEQFVTPSLLSRPLPLVTNSRLQKPFLIVRPGRRGRPGDVLLHIDGHIERRFLNIKNKALQMSKSDARSPVPEKSTILVADKIGDDLLIITSTEVRHLRFRR